MGEQDMSKLKVALMVDSGAFSTSRLGPDIVLKDYIAYLKRHERLIAAYVALDVMPSRDVSVERAAALSYRNFLKMQDDGLNPMPVFHLGEPRNALERLLHGGVTSFGLGGTVGAHRNEVGRWFDRSFSIINGSTVNVHAFGVAAPRLILRYPFSSVDSTSWIKYAMYGMLSAPCYRDGAPDYSRPPVQFHLTNRRGVGKESFDSFGPRLQQDIARFFNEEVGVSISHVRNSPQHRARAQIAYLLGLERQCPPLKIIFSTLLAKSYNTALNRFNVKNRLLSYYELRKHPDEVLEHYVRTGWSREHRVQCIRADWSNETYLIHRRLALEKRTRWVNSD
jgi:hypothetical protein